MAKGKGKETKKPATSKTTKKEIAKKDTKKK